MREDLRPYRDELIISTRAGYDMWPGSHEEWGSREYLIARLDQSLKRMGLNHVELFYSHRFGWPAAVSGATAAGQRDDQFGRRSQAGTLVITANWAPSGSRATANLPTPGMSLAGTTTVPPFDVTAAAAASQSATSK
jgi:L-glyceraldehyde 3-phosphate reductase